MVKRFVLAVAAMLVIVLLVYHELVIYGIRQASGQLKIVWNARPIDEVLNDPTFPDSLKAKLRLAEEVRKYAIDSLGLKDTKNYKTLYDQKGEEIMWVVTACEPFQLKAKVWRFPVLGTVPYKGFFSEHRAINEKKTLEAEGWDVNIRNPGGWSTLGWFNDPILSDMLNRSDGDLASLIIHEMVHATIFVKDSIEFNENLASFIGDRGAEKFLKYKFGKSSNELDRYIREDTEFLKYVNHILRGCNYLDSMYRVMEKEPLETKKEMKAAAIERIIMSSDSLALSVIQRPGTKYKEHLPNNAYFINFRRYQSKQYTFMDEWQGRFKGDLKAYIHHLSQVYPFL